MVPSGPDLLLNAYPRGGEAAAAHAEMAPNEQVPTVRLRRNRGRARYWRSPPRPSQRVAAASCWGRNGRAASLQAGAFSEVGPSQGCGQVPSRPASGGAWIGSVQGLPIPRDVVLRLSEYSWALHEPYTSLGNISPFVRMAFTEP